MAIGRTNANASMGVFVFRYSGQYELSGRSKVNGRGYTLVMGDFVIKFLTSGELYIKRVKCDLDVFAVGGGGGGRGCSWNDSVPSHSYGGAGAGGCRRTATVSPAKDTTYSIVIGAGGARGSGGSTDGGAGGDGGTTSAFSVSAPGGGGAPKSSGNYGGTNADGTGSGGRGNSSLSVAHGADGGYAFDDSSYGYKYGAGGAAYNVDGEPGTGGADGGGQKGSLNATANSGSGGGANTRSSAAGGTSTGGAGGSGIVIVRNTRS